MCVCKLLFLVAGNCCKCLFCVVGIDVSAYFWGKKVRNSGKFGRIRPISDDFGRFRPILDEK